MQDKDTTTSTLFQLFRPVLSDDLWVHIYEKVPGTDRLIRKLKTVQLFELLIHAEMQSYRSLDEISNSLNDEELSQLIRLESISSSTISRRLRVLPLEITQILFNSITSQIGRELGFHLIRQKLGSLYLIDSTTISLCLSQYLWAEFRKTKGGVKAHLRLKFDGESTPDKVIVTPAKPADKTQMDQLVVDEEGALNVFDRGYVDYKKWDDYCQNGIRFTSRLKDNAIIDVLEEFPLKAESPVKKDQKVRLGKAGVNQMTHEVRLVITEDLEGKPIVIVTNDFNLSAEEISDIYRYRWKIELFFKWIKQHLQIKHLFSKGKLGVENQIYIALMTYCLLQLIKLKAGFKGNLLAIKRLLLTCLHEPFTDFVRKLYAKGKRPSKGRQAVDPVKSFGRTYWQFLSGECPDLFYSSEIIL